MKTIQLSSAKKDHYVFILLLSGASLALAQLMLTIFSNSSVEYMELYPLLIELINRAFIPLAIVLGIMGHKDVTGSFAVRLIKTILLLAVTAFIWSRVSLYQTDTVFIAQVLAIRVIYCALALCLFNAISNGLSLIVSKKA